MELRVRNVNEAFVEGLWKMKTMGVRESSRNGDVLVFPEPVMTTYERPQERVLFYAERDANPFFHLLECLWMMAGRDDVEMMQFFNGKMATYSDDGKTFNGAYGHRWRNRFGFDQLRTLIDHLRAEPDTRRAVLTMWGPREDLANLSSKDVPCNTQAYFDLRGGRLNMTVCNRSNDMIWGAYGSNAVHFSFLQEFIAAALGAPLGVYRQFSNNLHLYVEQHGALLDAPLPALRDPYKAGVAALPVLTDTSWERWLLECEHFCNAPFALDRGYHHPFFSEVARPMALAYKERKEKQGDGGRYVASIAADDWRLACTEWIERREHAKNS